MQAQTATDYSTQADGSSQNAQKSAEDAATAAAAAQAQYDGAQAAADYFYQEYRDNPTASGYEYAQEEEAIALAKVRRVGRR